MRIKFPWNHHPLVFKAAGSVALLFSPFSIARRAQEQHTDLCPIVENKQTLNQRTLIKKPAVPLLGATAQVDREAAGKKCNEAQLTRFLMKELFVKVHFWWSSPCKAGEDFRSHHCTRSFCESRGLWVSEDRSEMAVEITVCKKKRPTKKGFGCVFEYTHA